MSVSRLRTFRPLAAIVAILVSLAAPLRYAPAGVPTGDTLEVSGHNFPDDYGRGAVDEDMPANGVVDVFDFTMGAGLPVIEGVTTMVGGMNWTINAIDFAGGGGGIAVNTPPSGDPLIHTVFDKPGKLIEITFDADPADTGLQSLSDNKFSRWGFAVEDLQFLDGSMMPETDPLVVWDATLYFYPQQFGLGLDASLFQSSFTIGPHPTNAAQSVIYLNVQDAASLSVETVFANGTAMFAIEPKQTDDLVAGPMETALLTFPIDGLTAGILVSQVLAGDANLNFTVDAGDYTTWANGFGMIDPLFQDGDVNGNGTVDAGDYTLWADNFGLTPGVHSPLSQAVPEPAGLVLLCVGVGLLACAGRRRRGK